MSTAATPSLVVVNGPAAASAPSSRLWRVAVAAIGGLLSVLGIFIALTFLGQHQRHYLHTPTASDWQIPDVMVGGWIALWGISLLLVAGQRWRLARGSATIACVMALAAIIGNHLQLAWCPLGVWLEHTSTTLWDCLLVQALGLVISVGVWILTAPVLSRLYLSLVHGLGLAGVSGLALLFILRVCAHCSYAWTGLAWLGASTLVCLVFLMVGFKQPQGEDLRRWFWPESIAAVGLVLTLGLWQLTHQEQLQRIQRHVQAAAAQAQRVWDEEVEYQTHQQQLFLARYGDKAASSQFRQVVSRYVGQTPGCLGVWQIDAEGSPQPVETVRAAQIDLNGILQITVMQALLRGEMPGPVVLPRSLGNGQHLLAVYAPQTDEQGNRGLLALYSLQQRLEYWARYALREDYAAVVGDEQREVLLEWQRHAGLDQPQWRQVLPLRWGSWQGRAAIYPTTELIAHEALSLPRWTLAWGISCTLLLALVTHLALTATARAQALKRTHREQQQTEAALRRSEQTYRTLVENLGQGIFWQDEQGRYLAVNSTYARWVGRAVEEISGATDEQLFSAERAARWRRELCQVLETQQGIETEESWEGPQGRRIIRRMLTPVQATDSTLRGVLGICWDVTELRHLERQLRQASKMDAIGQLAGGIAHDFNNLLTVIIGNLEVALQSRSLEEHRADLQAAHQAGERAAALTQRLLSFARNHQLDWRPVQLNHIVADVVEILRRTIDPRIHIHKHCDPELWPVRSDPNQLHQVLMNLCLNARDAITPPGTITIYTARVSAGARNRHHGLQAISGDFVRLSVQDTGCGMTEEVQARIFEPFFTTKPPGKGTGLGLSMVFAIVQQHHGWVECHSRLGEGTRFDIYLPRCTLTETTPASSESPACAPDISPHPAGRRGLVVLVVDDEDLVRQLARATLQTAGYQVLEASDGLEAVEIYRQQHQQIDLVLLDLTMPKLTGYEVFQQLRQINPQVLVLFASGYSQEQLQKDDHTRMAAFIRKPYRPRELVQTIRRLLRQRAQQETQSHSVTLPDLQVPVGAPECHL